MRSVFFLFPFKPQNSYKTEKGGAVTLKFDKTYWRAQISLESKFFKYPWFLEGLITKQACIKGNKLGKILVAFE